MAVTLGDTRALSTLGNTSSALPQWYSTLVRPGRGVSKYIYTHTHHFLMVKEVFWLIKLD